jgi:hypothetical protein
MEFHGKFHGIPWKIQWNSMEFHGIFHGIPRKNIMKKNPSNVSENFMEFHGKFHELTEGFSPELL